VTADRPKTSEMSAGPGFMIRSAFTRPSVNLVQAFAQFESTDVSDALNRLYTLGGEIHNLVNDLPLCGPALTVKVYPGDNLMVHKALDLAQPGDVIVVDASQSMTAAVVGDLVTTKARHRGIAGFIIDGLIRDQAGVVECGLPVYARGVTPFGPLHRGPGEINHPISCGGVVVQSGDIVCADRSGVTIVPGAWAPEILDRLERNRARLQSYVEDVKRGQFSNAWVDRQLSEAGCLIA
jgi:regulator of RNase E activity RraA